MIFFLDLAWLALSLPAEFFFGRVGHGFRSLGLFLVLYVFYPLCIPSLCWGFLGFAFPRVFSSSFCFSWLILGFLFVFFSWRDFFLFPSKNLVSFQACPGVVFFSFALSFCTLTLPIMLQTRSFFCLFLHEGGSLSSLSSLKVVEMFWLSRRLESLHIFFIASCRFQQYSSPLNNLVFFLFLVLPF